MDMYRQRRITAAVVATLVITGASALLWSGGTRAADEKKPVAKPALTVAAVVPQRVSLPMRLAANGNIVAWQEAVIGAEGAALRLTEVRVNVGDRVQKGQVLATFAQDTPRADVAQARAALAEAEAAASNAAATPSAPARCRPAARSARRRSTSTSPPRRPRSPR
jgi:HlyD family secretion protein